MPYLFTLLLSLMLSTGISAQILTRDFAYAGVTYRYRTALEKDSTLQLQIQAFQSSHQCTTVHKGSVSAFFSHPRLWRTTIQAARKRKDGWMPIPDSFLETTYDRARKQVAYFDKGALVQAAESELTDNFASEWDDLDKALALTSAIEYYIINYNRALGQHKELETEESIMLNQMMAERRNNPTALASSLPNAKSTIASSTHETTYTSGEYPDTSTRSLHLEYELTLPFSRQLVVDKRQGVSLYFGCTLPNQGMS